MRSPDGAARCAAVVTLGFAMAAAGSALAADATPEEAYVAYLRAVHGDSIAAVDAFLGPQALEQLRALPEIGRKNAIDKLRMTGLTEPPRVVKVEPKGDRVVLHLAATVDEDRVVRGDAAPVHPIAMTGQVELTRHGTTFTVDSEQWKSADGAKVWTGLVAPGVFRAELVKPDPTGWATTDIRAFIAAEAFFQSINDGYYGQPTCLAEPARCGEAEGTPAILARDVALLVTRYGYVRRFESATIPPKDGPRKPFPPFSVTSYAYWIVPETGAGGLRARCGDASGVICEMPDATAPSTMGQCPAAAVCTPIR